MHHAWVIEDIRYLIFEYLDHRDTFALSRTCKELFTPATNKLWETIPSFVPFLVLLPGIRHRPVEQADIDRLDLYGAKVRNVHIEGTSSRPIPAPREYRRPEQTQKLAQNLLTSPLASAPGAKVWDQIWKEILDFRKETGAGEFLPNLRRIRVDHAAEGALIPLIGITGLNLTAISIGYLTQPRVDRVVSRILGCFGDTPRLEHLFIRDGEPLLIISKLLRTSPLKTLRIPPHITQSAEMNLVFKTYQIQRELFKKSSLESLNIGLNRDWYAGELDIKDSASKYLPRLKRLSLDLTTFQPNTCHNEICENRRDDSWTCDIGKPSLQLTRNEQECLREPPSCFFQSLDFPELLVLKIRFPVEATNTMFLEVIESIPTSCRLGELKWLVLEGPKGAWRWANGIDLPQARIMPDDLHLAMKMLLPLPNLKHLRLSVAPNFLEKLDLVNFRSIGSGLPSLKHIILGHESLATALLYRQPRLLEKVPLQNVAAFCSMLPSLTRAEIGTVEASTIEADTHLDWTSPGVLFFKIHYITPRDVPDKLLRNCLANWFPKADHKGMALSNEA